VNLLLLENSEKKDSRSSFQYAFILCSLQTVDQEGNHEGVNMPCEDNDLIERLTEKLLQCEEELEDSDNELKSWIDSLKELSEIENAFKTDGRFRIRGKTVLDVGTDCVKPLYLALKFKPNKIVGINEGLSLFASDLKQKSRLFTETKIRLFTCSFFDNETLRRILSREKIEKFDFVLVSKTLHHLRSGECVAKERDEKHECLEAEKCCIYRFEEDVIFEKLLGLGKKVVIYEFFDPSDTDDDKTRGRGGYFTTQEWKRMFKHFSNKKYKVEFIKPQNFCLEEKTYNNVDSILRQVDCICFCVEKQDIRNSNAIDS
jgi:hypothetical protein